ncbi:hypothetical protein IAU60_001563 [Kwoniella sp. DSM 27419]
MENEMIYGLARGSQSLARPVRRSGRTTSDAIDLGDSSQASASGSQERRRRPHQTSGANPFTPGKNTLDESKQGSQREPTKEEIRKSRAVLGRGSVSLARPQQEPYATASRRSDKGASSLSPFDRSRPQQRQQTTRPAPSISTSSQAADDDADITHLPTPVTRGQSRSQSPVKPPSGPRMLPSPFKHQSQVSPSRAGPSKPPQRKQNLAKLPSDSKPYEAVDDDLDSSSSREDPTDRIQRADGHFRADKREDDPDINDSIQPIDVDQLETSSTLRLRDRGKQKDVQHNPTDDETGDVIVVSHSVSTPIPRSRRAQDMLAVNGYATHLDPPVTVRKSKPMLDRHGNAPTGPLSSRGKNVKNAPTHILSSISTVRPANPDIIVAWIFGNRRLSCRSLVFTDNSFRLVTTYGLDTEFWTIPFVNVIGMQHCTHLDHPFILLKISQVDSRESDSVQKLLADKQYGEVDVQSGVDLYIRFQDGLSSVKAIEFIRKELRGAKSRKADLQGLDETGCKTLSTPRDPKEDFGQHAERLGGDHSPADEQDHRGRRQLVADDPEQRKTAKTAPKRSRRKSSAGDEGPPRSKGTPRGKAVDDPSQSKLNFQAQPPPTRRSGRTSGKDLPVYDDSQPESIEALPPPRPVTKKSGLSGANKSELYFAYPPVGRADVNITYGDAVRLEEGEFLNDTLLEFGLRHVLARLPEQRRDECHLFNSFFYDKLSDRSKRPTDDGLWPAYQTVKKWSKGKEVFSKRFIIVPINEHMHWYLAVILNPGGILKGEESSSTSDVAGQATGRTSRATSTEPDEDPLALFGNETKRIHDDLNDLDSDAGDEGNDRDLQANASMVSNDPLDCIDQQEHGRESVKPLTAGVEDLYISNSEPAGTGGFIVTPTTVAFDHQRITASPEVVATKPAKKVRPLKPDHEVVGSDDCWILTFDSLGGPHKAVSTTLNAWLKAEARDKLNVDRPFRDAKYIEGRVPQQPNFYDCGLYVVHYASQLLERPEEVLSFVQRHPPSNNHGDRKPYDEQKRQVWKADETGELRNQWIETMATLASEFTLERERTAAAAPEKLAAEAEDEEGDDVQIHAEGDVSLTESVSAIAASQVEREKTETSKPVSTAIAEKEAEQHPELDTSKLPGNSSVNDSPKSVLTAAIPQATDRVTDEADEDIDPALKVPFSPGSTISALPLQPAVNGSAHVLVEASQLSEAEPADEDMGNLIIVDEAQTGSSVVHDNAGTKPVTSYDPTGFAHMPPSRTQRIQQKGDVSPKLASPHTSSPRSTEKQGRLDAVAHLRPQPRSILGEVGMSRPSPVATLAATTSDIPSGPKSPFSTLSRSGPRAVTPSPTRAPPVSTTALMANKDPVMQGDGPLAPLRSSNPGTMSEQLVDRKHDVLSGGEPDTVGQSMRDQLSPVYDQEEAKLSSSAFESPLNDQSDEEQEPVESRVVLSKSSISPTKVYGKKGAHKRTRASLGTGSNTAGPKKVKRNGPDSHPSGRDRFTGSSRAEAIEVKSDEE